MNRISVFFGIGAVLLVSIALFSYQYLSAPTFTDSTVVTLGGVAVRAMVADTEAERAQGLSGNPGLREDEGMFFVFETDGRYAFWMKDMLFAIDMVWLSENGIVVDLQERVGPDTYPQTFTPNSPARYVLEVPAGFAERHGVTIGSKAVF